MKKPVITVIVRDEGNVNYEEILIYSVEVDPENEQEVLEAVWKQREADLGELTEEDKNQISILFAFEGDLHTVADWRN